MSSKPSINPAAITVAQAADMLTKLGGREVMEATIGQHLKQGAPVNPDGTIHLVRYAAWLLTREGK